MKLTNKATESISNQTVTLKLALALGFSEVWVDRLIKANKDNGPLTTAKALQIIQEETGLTQDDILEESQELTKTG